MKFKNLFSKEKELFIKLINGILLIWLIIATVIIFSDIVNLCIKDPKLTYDEYKLVNCEVSSDDIINEKECKDRFNADEINENMQNYYYYRSIVICLANFLVVAGVMFLLNRDNEEEKTKKKKTTKK